MKMEKLKNDIAIPLYEQLCDTLKEQIKSGLYREGDKIPSEEQLSKTYEISRITVRNALQHLVDEDVLIKKKGKGTFVATAVRVESMNAGNSFTKSCLQINAVPSTKLISQSKEPAEKRIAAILDSEPEEKVICIKRLRLIDDVPAIFEIDYFKQNFDFLLQEDFSGSPLLEVILRNTGIRATSMEDIYEVKHATKEHVKHLKCKIGTPLLLVSQTIFREEDQKLYYNEQYICSERYKYATRSAIN